MVTVASGRARTTSGPSDPAHSGRTRRFAAAIGSLRALAILVGLVAGLHRLPLFLLVAPPAGAQGRGAVGIPVLGEEGAGDAVGAEAAEVAAHLAPGHDQARGLVI